MSKVDWKQASYVDLKSEIKRIKGEITADEFKSFFSNYPQWKLEDLRKGVDKYHSTTGKPDFTPVVKTVEIPVKMTKRETIRQKITEILHKPVVKPVSVSKKVSLEIPIELIPKGIYVEPLNEEQIDDIYIQLIDPEQKSKVGVCEDTFYENEDEDEDEDTFDEDEDNTY